MPLVSIISPCWNGERYIERMLESIYNQTYENIEMICINDGSTDRTEELICSYIDKLAVRGIDLKCINQSNLGQAAALNTGLKHIRGDFLSWIDCDDYLTEDSVEKKVTALMENPTYSIVTSDFFIVEGNNIETRAKTYGNLNYQQNQFYLTLVGKSIIESHCHMIRVEDFRKINPSMEISKCREGQNYQILLPILYHYKRLYIDEPLAYYVIRKDSHFHRKRTLEEWIKRYDSLIKMLGDVFISMSLPEWEIEKYINLSTFMDEKRRLMESNG